MKTLRIAPQRLPLLEAAFWLALAASCLLMPDKLTLLSQILVFGLFAVSLDMALGYAGILTVGHGWRRQAGGNEGAQARGIAVVAGAEPRHDLVEAGESVGEGWGRWLSGEEHLKAEAVEANGRFPPLVAFATQDEKRISFVRNYAEKSGLSRHGLEFQMLYGIRRDLQKELAAEGYPVRIYVPYGTHWYPYFMRRLAERPANVWFFISNFFKR